MSLCFYIKNVFYIKRLEIIHVYIPYVTLVYIYIIYIKIEAIPNTLFDFLKPLEI